MDLKEIASFISKDSKQAARKVNHRIRLAMRRLSEYPALGQLRNDLADETLRVWPVYSYLIVYRPETKPCKSLRVVHGARDVENLLRREQREYPHLRRADARVL